MRLWKKKSRIREVELWPDEVFLDSSNIPGFEHERFEGVLEKPLERPAFYTFGVLVFLFGGLLLSRAFWLQMVRGAEFEKRAESNYIQKTFIEPPRGIIYDRHGTPIVFNEAYTDDKGIVQYRRKTKNQYAYSQLLGHVGNISKDDATHGLHPGIVEVGKSGLEEMYNDRLQGRPGEHNQEIDASGKSVAEGLVVAPREGENITTTINADLQEFLWGKLDEVMRDRGFRGGAGIVFNVQNGEVLAMVNVPSYDLDAFARGLTKKEAEEIFSDPRAPLYNRAIAGTYAPGSIMKPFVALGALEEGIISPERSIYSSGALVIPNPYQKDKPSIFRDWKAHGYISMRRAIAESSDEYFYTVGGGFGDIKGLGVARIKAWFEKFGFDQTTGIDIAGEKKGTIPDPEWKAKVNKADPTWRIGDTYHMSIGQGDVLITPVEMVRALASLALHGKEITPHVVKGAGKDPVQKVNLSESSWRVVAEGMHLATKDGGTAAALSWLPFEAAAKTGTAEIGNKEYVNSWFVGYAPYENPKLGMVLFLESGKRTNLVGSPFVASETFRWIIEHGGIDAMIN